MLKGLLIEKRAFFMVFFLFIFILIFSYAVIAVECGNAPVDTCIVTQNTIFAPGNYTSVTHGIKINANNIVLDCNGAILNGLGSDHGHKGIEIIGGGNFLTIQNCILTNYFVGISNIEGLDLGVGGSIFNNGIIRNNQFNRNNIGIRLLPADTSLHDPVFIPSHNIIQDNIFLENVYGGIFISYGFNNSVKKNTLDFTNAPGADYGIKIDRGINNTVGGAEGDGNTLISVPGIGIDISGPDSLNSTISYNIIQNNGRGIDVENDNGGLHLIEQNEFDGNGVGLKLGLGNDSIVRDNSFMNSGTAIIVGFDIVYSSDNNLIYRNNFFSNINYAVDYGTTTDWDDETFGNYWDVYSTSVQGCNDVAPADNICDQPYSINANNPGLPSVFDNLPMVVQFSEIAPPDLQTIQNIMIDEGNSGVIVVNANSFFDLTYSITNPNFVVNDNVLLWQTNFDDAGVYIETITVTDEIGAETSQEITIIVNDVADTECSTQVRNSCTVSSDTTLPSGQSYNFKDGININSNGVNLNCAGSSFDGSGFGIVNTGVDLSGMTGVTLNNCNFENYDIGIEMVGSSSNSVFNSEVSFNEKGISLMNSNSNLVSNSVISDNVNSASSEGIGAYLKGSSNNIFTGNMISGNYYGVIMSTSSNSNTFYNNNIENNIDHGLRLVSSSSGNVVYNNNLINNNINAYSSGSSLSDWDFNGEGNYWDTYNEDAQGCMDNDYNGLCDAPYISANVQDNFPLRDEGGWINKWPIITSTPITFWDSGQYVYDVNAIDPDGDMLQYSIVNGPNGMIINLNNGVVTWNMQYPGVHNVIASASDGNFGVGLQEYELTVVCPISGTSMFSGMIIECVSNRP